MSEHEHPFPGNQVAFTDFNKEGDYSQDSAEAKPATLETANLLISKVEVPDYLKSSGLDLHRPVLDLDFPAKLVPSSTEGRYHLYLDKALTWPQYQCLLWALQQAGILEPGYVSASIHRGHTSVRLPWVKK